MAFKWIRDGWIFVFISQLEIYMKYDMILCLESMMEAALQKKIIEI